MDWKHLKLSPMAIDEELRTGTRRNAFMTDASADVRARMVAQARQLGLRGFVSSDAAASVKGVIEGTADKVDAFLDWCADQSNASPAAIDITDDTSPLCEFHDRDA
jgi:acylphosphatase